MTRDKQPSSPDADVRRLMNDQPPEMNELNVLTSIVDLAPEIVRTSQTGDSVIVQSDEITLRVEPTSDGWRVRKTRRDEDRGVAFRSETTEDVARYILSLLANDIRRSHGLPPVRRKLVLSDDGVAVPIEGFVLSGDPQSGFILSGGERNASRYFDSDLEAARFSYFADDDLSALRLSLVPAVSTSDLDGYQEEAVPL